METSVTRTSTLAVVSLVCGILCWIALPFVAGIVAVACGHAARSEIRRAAAGTIEGDGLALAGLILGWTHLLVCMLVVVAFLMFFGGLAMFAAWAH